MEDFSGFIFEGTQIRLYRKGIENMGQFIRTNSDIYRKKVTIYFGQWDVLATDDQLNWMQIILNKITRRIYQCKRKGKYFQFRTFFVKNRTFFFCLKLDLSYVRLRRNLRQGPVGPLCSDPKDPYVEPALFLRHLIKTKHVIQIGRLISCLELKWQVTTRKLSNPNVTQLNSTQLKQL